MGNTGRYIALEGIEGAGKTSVWAELGRRLEGAGREVVCVREPGGTPVGQSLRRILLYGDALSPWAEALLFAADRAHLTAEVVRPALARGAWVVSDRSVYSSLAYQGAGRGLGMDRLKAVNQPGLGAAWPDLVVLLEVSPRVGSARQEQADQAGLFQPTLPDLPQSALDLQATDRIGSEEYSFLAAASHAFGELAGREPERFAVINAERALDLVMEDVWAAVEGLS